MTAMIIERHYDDETLISLMETNRARADEHIPACSVCAEKLQLFRSISGTLRHHDVWDRRELSQEPNRNTIATLRAFANRMSFEDEQAEGCVRELLAGPREAWMPRLREHPEWRTAGLVRKLFAEMRRAVTTMPPDALEMTTLETEIADHLDPGAYAADTVEKLRGMAWHDHAYMLFYVGRFADALVAADRADAALQQCTVDEYDRARVAIVRALSLRAREDVAAATSVIRFSGETFVAFDDLERLASARIAETHLLFTRGEFEAARKILEDLEQRLRESSDAWSHAIVLGNLGYCLGKLGHIDEALQRNEAAVAIFEALGIHTEPARMQWSIALILASAGRVDEARSRFEAVQITFERLGMTSEAALVSLDIAELLLAREEFAGVEAICRAAMESFKRAGIAYTARALTALAYMREAAQHKTATPALVKHVREYIRLLPRDGELLFAPPPPDANFPTSR